jgi:Flp pilus assembly protein TadB
MTGPVTWLVLTVLGVVLIVVAFRLDLYAWRVTERRQQKRFRAELAALKRMYERETK